MSLVVGPLDSIPQGESPIMSNRKRKQQKRPHLNAFQLLMAKKVKNLVAAEKTYWGAISSLRQQRHETAISLALPYEEALPENISSTVWGLKDGVAFVRHKTVGSKARVDFRALPITLEQWGKEWLIVPPGERRFFSGASPRDCWSRKLFND